MLSYIVFFIYGLYNDFVSSSNYRARIGSVVNKR
jgi:hypothetical protein